VKRTPLTTAEREVWERIVRDGWSQMKQLFPRLAPYDSIEQMKLIEKLRQRPRR
jgi:hypothetical protein